MKGGRLGLTPAGPAAIGAAMQVGTRSVMNPMLWLCGISMPTFASAALFATGPLIVIFSVLASLPLLVALFAFLWFMFTDPDRLQSEPFRIEQQWVHAQIGDNQTQQVFALGTGVSATGTNEGLGRPPNG